MFSKSQHYRTGGLLLGVFILVGWTGYLSVPVLDITRDTSINLLDRYGRLISHQIQDDQRSVMYTDLSQIPDFFIQLALYREDRRFYHHYGVDLYAYGRVIRDRYRHGVLMQGASTIDQQLVKLLLEHHRRTWYHKIIEIGYARRLNLHYNKDQILLAYFNHLQFGSNVRGLALACQYNYDTVCDNLSKSQMIYLRSVTKFPGRKDISDYVSGFAMRLAQDRPDLRSGGSLDRTQVARQTHSFPNPYPHISEYITDQILQGQTGAVILAREGSNRQTSIDLSLTDRIQSVIGQYQPYLQSQDSSDVCVVVMQDRHIVSLNIARPRADPEGGMLNPCTRPRQVGSAIKPFVYVLALQKLSLTGGSTIIDEPVSFFLDHGGNYAPKNFDLKYHGVVSIGQALGSSLNIPAVKLLHQIGLDEFRSWLGQIARAVSTREQFVGNPHHYGLSLALGSIELSPIDFTQMYQIFTHSYPGLEQYQKSLTQVRQLLSDNTLRLISFPLQNRFDIPNTWVKSGTSRHFVDGWTCGGMGQYTICIRVGNYNAKPGRDSGYNTAGVLRHEIAKIVAQ